MDSSIATLKPVPIRALLNGSERLIQDLIANDPTILNLGPLELHSKEKAQPSGGRIDLILRDQDGGTRYEVEVQLGKTDESHIIRTIEYWDIERRRYPALDHIAVIIAEEVSGRFFNVLNLFNQNIPLIAIKMSAFTVGDQTGLFFAKILDNRFVANCEDKVTEATSSEWEAKAAPFALDTAKNLIQYCRVKIDPTINLKFNKPYLGTSVRGQVSNFITFRPQRNALRTSFHCDRTDELDRDLEGASMDWEYEANKYPGYRVRITDSEVETSRRILERLALQAYRDCEVQPPIEQETAA